MEVLVISKSIGELLTSTKEFTIIQSLCWRHLMERKAQPHGLKNSNFAKLNLWVSSPQRNCRLTFSLFGNQNAFIAGCSNCFVRIAVRSFVFHGVPFRCLWLLLLFVESRVIYGAVVRWKLCDTKRIGQYQLNVVWEHVDHQEHDASQALLKANATCPYHKK